MCQRQMKRTRSVRPDLDVLPKVLEGLVVVLVSGPFAAVHDDFPRPIQGSNGFIGKVLDFFNIGLPDGLALLAVVDIQSGNR